MWALKSFVREIRGTAERYNQLGEHPQGFLGYSGDGTYLQPSKLRPLNSTVADRPTAGVHASR
jgi:hypothetical protein